MINGGNEYENEKLLSTGLSVVLAAALLAGCGSSLRLRHPANPPERKHLLKALQRIRLRNHGVKGDLF